MFHFSDFKPLAPQQHKQFNTSCNICGGGCRLIVSQQADGKMKVMGDKTDPVSRGQLCRKGRHVLEIMNHPQRLTQPLKRVGEKGSGQWQAISWQEAIDYTAKQLQQTQQQWGNNSVFMAYGHSKDFINTQLLRLANGMKTANIVGPETVCWAPTKLGREYTLGYNPSHDISAQTRCILLWGVNKYKTRFNDVKALKIAVKAGAKTIAIDPQCTRHSQKADHWLPLTPGSDLALALAMLKVIIEEQIYDAQFVAQWCEGFTELKQHVANYELSALVQETGLSAIEIKAAARLYAEAKPAVIVSGNALDHNADSFQVNRAIACLMAITGNLDVPGGQFCSQEPSLISGRWPYDDCDVDAISAEHRAKSAGTPVLPEYFRATNQGITKAILEGGAEPVKAGFIVGANALLSWPDTHAVHQAFSRLEFLAVSELFMTPTTMMADIVFPAASFLEYEGITQGNDGSVRFQPKLSQVGEARSDHQIIADIGAAMGVMPAHDETQYWNAFLGADPAISNHSSDLDFAKLRAKQVVTPEETLETTPKRYRKYLTQGFPTASGKVELYSQTLAKLGKDAVPTYRAIPENPDFPLRLTTAKSKHYMFSHGRQITQLRESEPQPLVRVHPDTALQYGLVEGQKVTIEAANGHAIQQILKLDDKLAPNVAVADLSWWYPEQGEATLGGVFASNYNVLTSIDVNERGMGEAGSFDINGIAVRLS
ncbi:hypothetical protein A3K86_16080 [Photobacterium jeanii]|uniref:4Fe-4S Mo/W bis-MGD-type domain-containing protein n=1 Tax=Photobacterium jeanii TaxID=858640 RepID=A0A178K7S8_9GAMM|nr:molybdopterin-dependent oxidoreductase [Photobacterium jeanii]OAN13177.1 hypothetical protein A3K86_16080 [Photobacterium jeanii]PST89329.1 hypothetical protein C9I91_14525 [Photobacterium jeanii]